jgi:hypothetical protein
LRALFVYEDTISTALKHLPLLHPLDILGIELPELVPFKKYV